MAKFSSFEQILSWQKARELNTEIYMITNRGNFSEDYGLKNQIRRASISVSSNISEGSEGKQQKSLSAFYI